MDLSTNHDDCGLLIFDLENQDVHCGGSGCGCSAAVLTGLSAQRDAGGPLEEHPLLPHRRPPLPHLHPSGESRSPASATPSPSPLSNEPRHVHGKRSLIWNMLSAFLCGGILCLIGQLLIDKTASHPGQDPGASMWSPAWSWAALGVYQYLVDCGGRRGHRPPHRLRLSAGQGGAPRRWRSRASWGPSPAASPPPAGGITAAIFFGFLVALLFKSKPKS